jgi:hypothetical protein
MFFNCIDFIIFFFVVVESSVYYIVFYMEVINAMKLILNISIFDILGKFKIEQVRRPCESKKSSNYQH